ncbi:MAG: pseudouridine synthase [Pyrinomonadaceae bacterium]
MQKLISAAGIASRRQAEQLIVSGKVSINGRIVTELGSKADPAKDHIKVNGKLINPQLSTREKVYVLLNKPKGYLSSVSDPEGRPLVTELLPGSLGRLYPVGRLDFNTEGLLLLTNDGEFTNFITSARNQVEKVYEVKVKGVPPESALERLRRGVTLEDATRTAPARITKVEETAANCWLEVSLHQGRNQQVRRMFELIGYSVVKLKRVKIGFLVEPGLKPGEWRFLTKPEVARFMRGKEKNGRAAKVSRNQKQSRRR